MAKVNLVPVLQMPQGSLVPGLQTVQARVEHLALHDLAQFQQRDTLHFKSA